MFVIWPSVKYAGFANRDFAALPSENWFNFSSICTFANQVDEIFAVGWGIRNPLTDIIRCFQVSEVDESSEPTPDLITPII